MSKHSTTLHMLVSFGRSEVEIPAEVSFNYTPGSPATGPTYASGGQPADPAEVEIEAVELSIPDQSHPDGVRDLAAPDWLVRVMQESDDVYEQLLDAVPDDDGPDPDDARDDRMERDRMERDAK